MSRPLPDVPRPAWRELQRSEYLARAAAKVCVRATCGQPVAPARYGRPGVFCAVHKEAERQRVADRKAAIHQLRAAAQGAA